MLPQVTKFRTEITVFEISTGHHQVVAAPSTPCHSPDQVAAITDLAGKCTHDGNIQNPSGEERGI